MRSADQATILRTAMIVLVLFLVIARANPFLSIIIFAMALLLDSIDGYLAIREASGGRVSVADYLASAAGNAKTGLSVAKAKAMANKRAGYGPRLDVAADRITELAFWMLFTYLHLLPFFLLLIILARHSIVDAFMGAKGTSSKMRSRAARALYSSNWSRALANILKFVTFSYLILEYVSGYPAIIGTALAGILAVFIIIRGATEVYESA
jgi:phosphatidylglycerophosphate synthase